MADSMPSLSIEDYHVGIICALESEVAAVEGMLDEEHKNNIVQDIRDKNAYVFGRIHTHNVVIACLPAGIGGLAAAATVAKDMSRTFTGLRFGLSIGIGGGIPNIDHGYDIRLGDIVVSEPSGTTGGVVQYEKGKRLAEGAWERKGIMNAPPTELLTALQRLKARHLRHDSVVSSLVATMLQRNPNMIKNGYGFPGQEHDCLRSGLQRQGGTSSDVVPRSLRETNDPEIHYGVIASGNQVIQDEVARNHLSREFGALCVEMEAAGLMNNFPCIVIRGICSYADGHKNERWHRYAAATAAAYAKELLSYVSPKKTRQEAPIQQIHGK